MNRIVKPVLASAAIAAAAPSLAAITFYDDRAAFTSATRPNLVETFTSTSHTAINGHLNSTTTDAGLAPGDILPGVTYSTQANSQFQINTGAGFDGGFLDSLYPSDPVALTITFDTLQSAFGFDTNLYMDPFIITISSDTEILFSEGLVPLPGVAMQFFGFASPEANIRSAVFSRYYTFEFSFALDNFTFGGSISPFGITASPVPEPATWALLLTGFGLTGASLRLRNRTSGAILRLRNTSVVAAN